MDQKTRSWSNLASANNHYMDFFRIIWSFLKDEHYRELLFISATALITGTIVFHLLEGWSWLDSLYFSMVTLTTVGYGDFSPQTSEGKIFTMIYIIIGVGITLNFIQVIFDHFKEERQQQKERNNTNDAN